MLAVYDDRSTVRCALEFEAALAQAQAAEAIIEERAADEISAICASLDIDPQILADEAAFAGTLAIPLIGRIRSAIAPELAVAVHKGATSQDLADTVMMMQAKEASALLIDDADRLDLVLTTLAEKYRRVPAVGRTLMQNAMPISFGLRIAQWRAGVVEAAARMRADVGAYTCVQLGGGSGTRAGMSGRGSAVTHRLSSALQLNPAPPWHSRRIAVAAIGTSVGILVGAVGKIAKDIALLSQDHIREALEPTVPGRGGSSAMPHKRNPTGCQVALSAAHRAPGLVATLLGGLPQEQERGLGGWQTEASILADLFSIAAGAIGSMVVTIEGLQIDGNAIACNLSASTLESDIGESEGIVRELLNL
jgi:3-carboxy-cis,cis-muconate cycloisomerase